MGQTLRIRSALKPTNVCYAPNSDHFLRLGGMTRCAKSATWQRSKQRPYSITSIGEKLVKNWCAMPSAGMP